MKILCLVGWYAATVLLWLLSTKWPVSPRLGPDSLLVVLIWAGIATIISFTLTALLIVAELEEEI